MSIVCNGNCATPEYLFLFDRGFLSKLENIYFVFLLFSGTGRAKLKCKDEYEEIKKFDDITPLSSH